MPTRPIRNRGGKRFGTRYNFHLSNSLIHYDNTCTFRDRTMKIRTF
jgi:hypothetical protein